MNQQTLATITVAELEALVRRVVREELVRLVQQPAPDSILDDWSHEDPDAPDGDQELLEEALAALAYAKAHPETLRRWEDVQADLDRAEAAGELPD